MLLRVALKPCGQGLDLPCVNRAILLFLMDPSSALPTGTCDWKAIMWSTFRRSHFRNVMIIAEFQICWEDLFSMCRLYNFSDKFNVSGIQIIIHVFLRILGKTCIYGFHH